VTSAIPRDEAPEAVPAISRFVGARMLPLALFLILVVALSAPLASVVLGTQALDGRADATAREVAGWIRGEVQQRPALWRYDTAKVVEHLRAYAVDEDVETIVVVDEAGLPLPLDDPLDRGRLAATRLRWAASEVFLGPRRVGTVWVAVSAERILRDALWLFLLFSSLGVALAVLMYRIPLRAARDAEGRIRHLVARLERSRADLAGLNRHLEAKVDERSSELRDAYDRLRDHERHLRELSSQALAQQEHERRAIARDLHDSVGQALTAVRIHLRLISERDRDPELLHMAERSIGLIDEAIEEIRRTVKRLGPAILDDLGLAEALRRHCDDFAERTGILMDRRIEDPAAVIPDDAESACYRIVQEALTNVARHAGARSVQVGFQAADTGIHLQVRDDGTGFDPSRRDTVGRGLVGIRERVELLGGTLSIVSAPGEGCTLRVALPRAGGGDPADRRAVAAAGA